MRILNIFLITFSAVLSFTANAQWLKVYNGLPSDSDWFYSDAIDASDNNTAIIVFRTGSWNKEIDRVFLTTSSGNNWNEIKLLDSLFVTDISIIDRSSIYISSQGYLDNAIYCTKDGGKTWKKQNIIAEKVGYINYIRMFDILNGVAISDYTGFGEPLGIFQTTNGGNTWIQRKNNSLYEGSTTAGWMSFDFINMRVGFIRFRNFQLGQSVPIYKTIDSGNTWIPTSLNYSQTYTVKLFNEKIGMINQFHGKYWLTKDGGESWRYDSINTTHYNYGVLTFAKNEPSRIWSCWGTFIYFSSDTGRTWVEQQHPDIGTIIDIVSTDNSTVWILGAKGVLRTSNCGISKVEEKNIIPINYSLSQNYPNPFNPSTVISFQLPVFSYVKLIIYDILGREVTKLTDEELSVGYHSVTWNAKNIASGLYYYKLVVSRTNPITAGNFVQVRKMILIK